tara:strand:+ start:514 stop:822 length:309 start_codon:yes stop_codon:yes gene_type:complete
MENEDYRIIDLHNNSLKVFRCGKVEVKRKHNDDYYDKKCCMSFGYLRLPLYHNKGQKGYYIHRIVAVVFGIIPTIDTDILMNHIDNNRLNNDVTNLRTTMHV